MKKNSTSIYLAAFILFAAATGWLCYMGFTENSVYFLNVSEAKAADQAKLEKARLFGVVAANSISRNANALEFNLADKDLLEDVIPVSFNGMVPDNFREGAEIIVEGGIDNSGKFKASTLMTKCPSKYKKENRQAMPARKTL